MLHLMSYFAKIRMMGACNIATGCLEEWLMDVPVFSQFHTAILNFD